jgi:Tol biopolymer transport system component
VSNHANISVAAADGSTITQLTSSTSNLETIFYPTWSPDGATIAFVHGVIEGSVWHFSVRVMNADGTNVRVLAAAGDTDAIEGSVPGSVSWSPDGDRIAFTAFTPIARSIRYVTLDGTREGLIVANGQDPSWRR